MCIAAARPQARRWVALVFIALAQLMVALDATIVTIALPSAQADLDISAADRHWVITAYTLAFGGLVLFGGRIADQTGRKRALLLGLLGFAAASAVGGAARDSAMLLGARAAQGVFAALLAPTALSLLAVTFTETRDRAKAFAVYGTIASSGAAVGLILGGLLAQYLSWRWCLWVNVPVAVLATAGAWLTLPQFTDRAGSRRLDVPGALLCTAGLAALVYACARSVATGWESPLAAGWLSAAAALLAGFVVRESRAAQPLLPLRILTERNRLGAYLSMALAIAGMLGMFLFVTYYLQQVLGYTPVQAGLAFLPMTAAVLGGANLFAARALPHVAPRALIVPGLLIAAVAMGLLGRLSPASGYASHVLPAEILLGLGMGCVFVPATNTATQNVEPRDAGVAAAVVNTSQQVGGSIGTAVLNSTAASATAAYLATRAGSPVSTADGLVHGFAVAATWGAGILATAAVLAAVLINANKPVNANDGSGSPDCRQSEP